MNQYFCFCAPISSHFSVLTTMSSDKDDTTVKWKVFTGYLCNYDYCDWEDEVMACCGLKNVQYLLTDSTYTTLEPPTQAKAAADEAKMQLLKDYNLVMSIFFGMTSEHPRKMVHRATVPQNALKALREKYLKGKSNYDYFELSVMWDSLKLIAKEVDPDVLMDLMLEINERMEDVHPDLKKKPIDFYAKYIRITSLALLPSISITLLWSTVLLTRKSLLSSVELSKIIGKLTSREKILQSWTSPRSTTPFCDYCGKNNHDAFKDGKPFCFKLIKDLKAGNSLHPSPSNKTCVFCKYCKSKDHDVDRCPKLAKKRNNADSGLNHLFIGAIDIARIVPLRMTLQQIIVYQPSLNVEKPLPIMILILRSTSPILVETPCQHLTLTTPISLQPSCLT